MTRLAFINNKWVQRKQITPNADQTTIITASLRNGQVDKTLLQGIRVVAFLEPSAADISAAQAVFDDHKPAQGEVQTVDIALPDGKGSIVYSLSGESRTIWI